MPEGRKNQIFQKVDNSSLPKQIKKRDIGKSENEQDKNRKTQRNDTPSSTPTKREIGETDEQSKSTENNTIKNGAPISTPTKRETGESDEQSIRNENNVSVTNNDVPVSAPIKREIGESEENHSNKLSHQQEKDKIQKMIEERINLM